jgi:LEA14-like dessication related protein
LFKKINKIDKLLANLTKMRKDKTQISKIKNKKGEKTTNTKEIQGIIRVYLKNLYPINLKILKKWTNL